MPAKRYTENSEEFKELLHDYLNFETTGWKPFDTNLGGADHYKSRGNYWANQVGSRHAFRGLAKKVAGKALALIPNSTLEKHGYDPTLEKVNDDETTKQAAPKKPTKASNVEDDDEDDGNNTNMEKVVDLTGEDDHSSIDQILLGYTPGQMRKPYVLQYPTGNKVGIVCCLDGDVDDKSSNKFKLSKDSKTITRSRRVPKECLDAEILLNGINEDKVEGVVAGFGSSDLDVVVLGSALQKRLKGDWIIRDEHGDIWEPRDVIELPFPCLPTMVSIEGKAMNTFKVRKNKHGFRWAYFWLVGKHAHVAAGASESKRFGGTRVTNIDREDDTSMFSYQTVPSKTADGPVKSIKFKNKKNTSAKHKLVKK